jgi:hypothetical protein
MALVRPTASIAAEGGRGVLKNACLRAHGRNTKSAKSQSPPLEIEQHIFGASLTEVQTILLVPKANKGQVSSPRRDIVLLFSFSFILDEGSMSTFES